MRRPRSGFPIKPQVYLQGGHIHRALFQEDEAPPAQAVFSSGTAKDCDLTTWVVTLLTLPLLTMEDGIFEVTATAGDAPLGTEDSDNQIGDVRKQNSKRNNRGKDLAGNDPAVRHVRTECQRAKPHLVFFHAGDDGDRCSA